MEHVSKTDTPELSVNLRTLLDSYNLNTNQLAQALGIPMMTVRRLLSGETTDPRISTLKLVADYFKTSIDALVEGNNQMSIKLFKKSKPIFVPILEWDTAEKITTIQDIDLSQWTEWQPVSFIEEDALSNNAFALESRPSMGPRFPQGTIFIIDPGVEPIDGDLVLVKIRENNELTLRELAIDPPEWRLKAIVPGSSSLQYSKSDHEIVGVNLLTMWYSRRTYL